jgi:predicted DNA binding CopG/RHH family protein
LNHKITCFKGNHLNSHQKIGIWKNSAKELQARNTLKKDKRINLRLSQKDYHQIQVKAIEEGIPYQTLISSLVHKYLNGSLTVKQ